MLSPTQEGPFTFQGPLGCWGDRRPRPSVRCGQEAAAPTCRRGVFGGAWRCGGRRRGPAGDGQPRVHSACHQPWSPFPELSEQRFLFSKPRKFRSPGTSSLQSLGVAQPIQQTLDVFWKSRTGRSPASAGLVSGGHGMQTRAPLASGQSLRVRMPTPGIKRRVTRTLTTVAPSRSRGGGGRGCQRRLTPVHLRWVVALSPAGATAPHVGKFHVSTFFQG